MKIELTDEEWMSLLDPEGDALPRCCANISALRDDIYSMVRDSRELTDFWASSTAKHFYWVLEGHWEEDFPPPAALTKLFDQCMLHDNFKKTWEALEKHDDAKDPFEMSKS